MCVCRGVSFAHSAVFATHSVPHSHWRGTQSKLARLLRVDAGTFEAAVRVLAVVEGHAVDAQHVGLEVALLGGAVGAVATLEGLAGHLTCGERASDMPQKRTHTYTTDLSLTVMWDAECYKSISCDRH